MSADGDRALAAYRRTLAAHRSDRRTVDALWRQESAATPAYTRYHDARRAGREPIAVRNAAAHAYLADGEPPPDGRNILSRPYAYGRERKNDAPTNPPPGTGFQTARQLAANPPGPKEWRVDGLIPTQGLVLTIADPGVGKSTWGRALAAAVSRGRRFMGRETATAPVLVASFEGDPRTAARHINGLDPDPDGFSFGRLGAVPQPVEWLAAEAERTNAKLIVLDTLFRWLAPEEGNEYGLANRYTQPVLDLTNRTDCVIVAIHHAGKERGDALGSQAWAGAAETIVKLEKRGEARTLAVTKQREGDELPATVIELTDAGDIRVAGTVAERARAKVEQGILDALDTGDVWRTASALAEATGHTEKPVRAYLNQATAAGVLKRRGRGENGHKSKSYQWALARRASDSDSFLPDQPQ